MLSAKLTADNIGYRAKLDPAAAERIYMRSERRKGGGIVRCSVASSAELFGGQREPACKRRTGEENRKRRCADANLPSREVLRRPIGSRD